MPFNLHLIKSHGNLYAVKKCLAKVLAVTAFVTLSSLSILHSQCNITPLVDPSALPDCGVPGEVFNATISYDYQGEVPASIDTIILTDASAPGFEILSYGPTDIVVGRNELDVSIIFNGECNPTNLFVCDIIGGGGAADCTTTIAAPIDCCEEEETSFCNFDLITDLSKLPRCATPGETFMTIIEYDYDGDVPASIDTIIVLEESAPGFEILSYSPTEINEGRNEIEVSVRYDGDCNESNLFICDVIGAGGAAECSTTVSSTISCCENPCGTQGGVLSGGPFEFCVGDGEADRVSGVEVSDNSGTNGQWVVTGENTIILGLPPRIEDVNFDVAPPGECFIWFVSYENISGLEPGELATDLTGCFSFSKGIPVNRVDCEAEPCMITPDVDAISHPDCVEPGEVITVTIPYEYSGELPASLDTIVVWDPALTGVSIVDFGPKEISLGTNELTIELTHSGECDLNESFVIDLVGAEAAFGCDPAIDLTIPCCTDDEECVITPITDLSTLPTCVVPGEVFTTTLAYDYQGSLPASIDTIIVTEASDQGFEILSYEPTEIQRGTNEIEVSVVYNGDCDDSNIFVCDVIGAGGAADCSTTITSPIACCDPEEKCVVTPLTDLSTLPTCAVPGEVFTTTLAYDYQGSLPANIDTIIVTDDSSPGFQILSYSPTEIQRGTNEIEVSVVYDGDCDESNIFICDVVGGGGAADCSTTVSSPIPCCDVMEECVITPITDISTLPTCAVPGEVFTTTLVYDYQGSLPASIDTIIVTEDSAEGFEIISYSPTEIQLGQNELEVSVVYNGECLESDIFVCDVVGAGGAADCSTTVSSVIPCCDTGGEGEGEGEQEEEEEEQEETEDCGDDDQDGDGVFDSCDNCPSLANEDQRDDNGNGIGDECEEACEIEPIIEGLEIPECLNQGESFSTTLQYNYSGSLPASIDTIIIREESSPGFEILEFDPSEIQEGVNDVDVTIVFNGDCGESNLFICDIIGAGGAQACTFTISSSIQCCEANFIEIESFPNPTSGVVFVKAEERSNYNVEVFDYDGKKLMSTMKEDSDFFIIPTESLNNGSYIMKITDMESGKIGTEKIAVFK